MMPLTSPLRCGHASVEREGHKLLCRSCLSFHEAAARGNSPYVASYPRERGHFDVDIMALKVRTLERWMKLLKIDLRSKAVCEVGFGGGGCLQYIRRSARTYLGIEVIRQNLEHAKGMGLERVIDFERLPNHLEPKIDLWIFQDSFEHIKTPGPFLDWLSRNSSPAALLMMVLPRADCFSEKLMGKCWIHRTPDHDFHWSLAGVSVFLNGFGFNLARSFAPQKYLSLYTIFSHVFCLCRKTPIPIGRKTSKRMSFLFNMGEMGLLFQKG